VTVIDIPRSTATSAKEHSRVQISSQWWSWGGAHGGLLMAVSAEAVRRVAPGRTLRSLTTHFLAPVDERPLDLLASPERISTSASTVVVRAEQDGALAALSVAASVNPRPALELGDRRPMPVVRGPEDCVPFRGAELLFAFPQQVDIRPADEILPLSGSAVPRLTAWLRLRATDVVDTGTALVLLDTLAPAAYASWTVPAVIPTVQLTAHLLRDLDRSPHNGWVLAQQRHVHTRDGISVDGATCGPPRGS
jgi:acyl-CoA thioesterase